MNAYRFLCAIAIIAILLTELLFAIIVLLPLETGQIASGEWPTSLEKYIDQHENSLQ